MHHPPKSPTRTIPFFITLAACLVGLSLWSTTASAQHRHRPTRHAHPPRDVTVTFDQVNARVVNGALHVEYRIDHRDWRTMRRANIQPRLNLYTPAGQHGGFTYAYAVPVHHRAGTVVFPRGVTPRRAGRVELRVTGNRGRVRVTQTRYGSACGTRVRVAVHRPQHHVRPRRVDRVALIEACSASMTMSDGVASCVTRAQKLGPGAARVVAACGEATHWNDEALACIDSAAAIRSNRVATVRACSEATHWQDDFRGCLQRAGAYAENPAPTVRACSAATNWSDDFEMCLVEARAIRRDAASVVAACDAGTHWSDDFRACVRAASRT